MNRYFIDYYDRQGKVVVGLCKRKHTFLVPQNQLEKNMYKIFKNLLVLYCSVQYLA